MGGCELLDTEREPEKLTERRFGTVEERGVFITKHCDGSTRRGSALDADSSGLICTG